jgi:hypothetical protein
MDHIGCHPGKDGGFRRRALKDYAVHTDNDDLGGGY